MNKKSETPTETIFSAILKDHREFRSQMCAIMELADAKKLEEAKRAYLQFRTHLHAHAEAEEKSLYTTLLGKSAPGKKLADQVLEGKEEHHVADLLMHELTDLGALSPKWKAKFGVFKESVEHHLKEEEEYMESWKKHLHADESKEIFERFLNVKTAIMRSTDLMKTEKEMSRASSLLETVLDSKPYAGLYARH